METSLDQPEGDLVYPTDAERYRYNAGDVVEVRVQPTRNCVTYRTVLNTMVEGHEDAAAVAIGIDTGDGDRTDGGHGLGDLGSPVDTVIVMVGRRGAGAEHSRGRPLGVRALGAGRRECRRTLPGGRLVGDPLRRRDWRGYDDTVDPPCR